MNAHHQIPVEQKPLQPVRLPQRTAGDRRADAPVPPLDQSVDQRRQRALLAVVGKDGVAQIPGR